MPKHHDRVQYPELDGSDLHHDLKNQPGEKGDADHAEDGPEQAEDGIVDKAISKVKSALSSD